MSSRYYKDGGDCSPPPMPYTSIRSWFTISITLSQMMFIRCTHSNLVLCLKLFGDILTGCHLLYQLKNHIFRLIVQISKIIVQFAGDL